MVKKITLVLVFNDKNINIANFLSKISNIEEKKVELIIFNECSDIKNKNIVYLFLGLISKFKIQYFESDDFFNELECYNEILDYVKTDYIMFMNDSNYVSLSKTINKIHTAINENPSTNVFLLKEKSDKIYLDKPILLASSINYMNAVYSVEFLKTIKFNNMNFSFTILFFLIVLYSNKKELVFIDAEYNKKSNLITINYAFNIFQEIEQIYNFFMRKKMFQNSRDDLEYLFVKLLVFTYFDYFKGEKTQSLLKKIKKVLNDFLLNYKNNSYINNDVELLDKFNFLLEDIDGK